MRESTGCELRFVVFGGFGIGDLFGQKVEPLKREKRVVCDRVYRTAESPTPLSSSSITRFFSSYLKSFRWKNHEVWEKRQLYQSVE
jgi:hypothetical protein